MIDKCIVNSRWSVSVMLQLLTFLLFLQTAQGETIVTVNGHKITTSDVEFLAMSRRIPQANREAMKERLVDLLIERHLMGDYLKNRKVTADAEALNAQVRMIHELITRQGDKPEIVLEKLGFNDEKLRKELALPLAWERYIKQVTTPEKLREYYRPRQAQYDGTQVRAQQVFLKVDRRATAADVDAARDKLNKIRERISSKQISFADAVVEYSQSPSKEKDGDLGWFGCNGRVPKSVARAALALKVNDLSAPVRSPFGWHLLNITDRKPGQESLEDVRQQVFDDLSRDVWQQLAKQLRDKASIRRENVEPPATGGDR